MADEQDDRGADVALKVAGQEFNVRNVKSLNTILTAATLFIVCLIATILWMREVGAQNDKANAKLKEQNEHAAIVDAIKESNRATIQALKEMQTVNATLYEKSLEQGKRQEQATRETNCLLSLPQDRRINAADACRRISR